MKSQYKLFSLVTVLFFSFSAFAQKNLKSEEIKVWGNCGMCKKTIETAAKNAGVDSASWSTETHILKVSYNSKKTGNEKIQKAVAAAGYDTQDFTAPDSAYDNLHSCCQYDRKAETAGVTKTVTCAAKDCAGAGNEGKCTKEMDCCKDNSVCKDKGCCKS